MTASHLLRRSGYVIESCIPLVAHQRLKMTQLKIEKDTEMPTAVTLVRLQRTFALRPLPLYFSHLPDLTILGYDRLNNTIESSALHF